MTSPDPLTPAARVARERISEHPLVKAYRCEGDSIYDALGGAAFTLGGYEQATGESAGGLNALLRIIHRHIDLATLTIAEREDYERTAQHIRHVRECGAGSCEHELYGIRNWRRNLTPQADGARCTRYVAGEGRHRVQASCPLAPGVPCSPEVDDGA